MSASVISTLDLEREHQLLKLFPEPVRLHLLYKATELNSTFPNRFHGVGPFVFVVYLSSGVVRGAYMNKPPTNQGHDENVFLFDVTTTNATKISPEDDSKIKISQVFSCNYEFGNSFKLRTESVSKESCLLVYFSSDEVFNTGWPDECYNITKGDAGFKDLELFRVTGIGDVLPSPWREVSWTERTREDFRESFVFHKVFIESLNSVRVLLLGPTGSGKSSFVNSVRSVMFKRTTHMPASGAGAPGHFKKLKSSIIRAGRGGSPTSLTLCEVMALGEGESAGLSVSDALAVVKGHVPEGYSFQSDTPCNSQTSGYRADPGIKDRIHCVLFVLDARKITTYDGDLQKTIRMLQAKISDLDVPQIVLLTHVDQLCHAEDVKYVYTSRAVKDKMQKAAEFVSMPMCHVLPVKNYAVELDTDCNNDILILSAVHSVLQAIDDTLDDQCVSSTVE
ncbi:interferon-induced protein 44-like [Clupea harengus]|uniref:Interferon-induced protein 44-like n=1 Tax=Clupea harengus TaxID=7950 RepID=A0A8M1KCT8_CLUHA|nr:interferon-induced protein 44-like [Clupea harengus]